MRYIKLLIIVLFSPLSLLLAESYTEVADLPIRELPVVEVSGDLMPGWEHQIKELYTDEDGNPVPVVFRNAAKNWPAASWTLEGFTESYGKEEVEAYAQDDSGSYPAIQTTVHDAIQDMLENPENAGYFMGRIIHNSTDLKYTDNKSLEKNAFFMHKHLNLASETSFPQLARKYSVYVLFIGSENTVANLHSHPAVFLAQIYGEKLATLLSPKYMDKFCVGVQGGTEYNSECYVDIMDLDFEEYPELNGVEVYQLTLQAGDIVYIPDGWLHDIRALSKSISIASGF